MLRHGVGNANNERPTQDHASIIGIMIEDAPIKTTTRTTAVSNGAGLLAPPPWVILPAVKGRHHENKVAAGHVGRALAIAAALALAILGVILVSGLSLAVTTNDGAAAKANAAPKSKAKSAPAPVPIPKPRPERGAELSPETPPPAPAATPPPPTVAARLTSQAEAGPPIAAIKAGALPVTLPFNLGSTDLSEPIRVRLDAIADSLVGNDKRVQLLAFAKAEGADASYVARRLSLERALAVRGYLIGKGIRSTRIDVRALGANGTGPIDRVEVVGAGR
jgi:outer membrane protein OmpA-like peptidoglycan-associated protein